MLYQGHYLDLHKTGSANPGTPNEVGGLGSGLGSSVTGGASGSRVG